jgi:hypothetical protein
MKQTQQRMQIGNLKVLINQADEFYHHNLLIRWGFAPWIKYLQFINQQQHQAWYFYQKHLFQRCFQRWYSYYMTVKTENKRIEYRKQLLAEQYYRRKLIRFHFQSWKLYRKLLKGKAIAIMGSFSRYTLPRRCFTAWKIAYQRSIREMIYQLKCMEPRGQLVIKRYYWQLWKVYFDECLLERSAKQRSEMKWQQVKQWLRK